MVKKYTQLPAPRNYLARREQLRLLMLVGGLGLIVILMVLARQPANWHWFTSLTQQPNQVAPADAPAPDNRFSPISEDAIPGTFISPGPIKPTPRQSEDYFPGLKLELLDKVRDNTFFRHQEQPVWFYIMGVLSRADETSLIKASTGQATYVQLTGLSKEYRGKLVTLCGHVVRAHPLTAPENEDGIGPYYMLWFLSEDNPTTPMVIYVLELPEDFPQGMNLSEKIVTTGFFFKRWVYQAQDGLRTTPIVLAKTVDWQRKPSSSETPRRVTLSWEFFVIVISAAVFASVTAIFFIFFRTKSGGNYPVDMPPLPKGWQPDDEQNITNQGQEE